jgi:hypothetical protein
MLARRSVKPWIDSPSVSVLCDEYPLTVRLGPKIAGCDAVIVEYLGSMLRGNAHHSRKYRVHLRANRMVPQSHGDEELVRRLGGLFDCYASKGLIAQT